MSAHVEQLPSVSSPTARSSRGKRTRRFLWAGAAVLATAGAAGVVAIVTRGDDSLTAPKSDVPRRVGDAIETSAAFRDAAGIRTTPATRRTLAPLVKAIGSAEFDPRQVAAVGTRAPGIVRSVLCVEGDVVEKGALLAEIESPRLVDTQADLKVAVARKEAAARNAQRERALFDKSLTTARELEQANAELAEQQALETAALERVRALGGAVEMGTSELRSPVSGLVAVRAIAPGQNVGASHTAFRIGDMDQLWVLLRVFARHVELVRPGDSVEIHPLSDLERTIAGRVAHVGAVLDEATHTTDLRIEVDNDERVLRPGQAVQATIRASGPARDTLTVPASAVTTVDGAQAVFVAETPTRFAPRKVEVGLDGGDVVEVTKGVTEGEQVVSSAVLALKSELFR